ncbi:MAG: c-type cytochrome [Xanthomonadales bacterium]|nr:c-type cytochrome [Xanthomonadales bacterium]
MATLSRWTVIIVALLLPLAGAAQQTQFEFDLARVDDALRNNPTHALRQSLESCLNQRNHAVALYRMGMHERAGRALKYCFISLHIPENMEMPKSISPEELRARSDKEYKKALELEPDIANGLEIYRMCAACHEPEGWGRTTGSVPQIAGQHRNVVIHQLTDYRAGNRESVVMAPYADPEALGGAQAVADVAGYISTLEMSVDAGHGDGKNLELGEQLYKENCADCHGANGEGSNDDLTPRLQAQHYKYLLRQFDAIRSGKRLNADPKMAKQIRGFSDKQVEAVLDYTSRLMPPEILRAKAGWRNPDFARPAN